MHAGNAPTAQAIIIGFPDFGVGSVALLRLGQQLSREFGSAVQYIDTSARYTVEREVIRIGNIPAGFPRKLLHRYIFGDGSPLVLTPGQFLKEVGPKGSIYDPNAQSGNPNELPFALYEDIRKNLSKTANPLGKEKVFYGTYEFSCFHGAHSTAGLGHFTMTAIVHVSGTSPSDWRLDGTAVMKPNDWDFDWTIGALVNEVITHHPLDGTDLHGRERRTAMGWTMPGKPFPVSMSLPVRVQERSSQGVSKVLFSL